MEEYPQIIYGDKVRSYEEFVILSEEFEVHRCIVCGNQFWEYLGGIYDKGFVCETCEEKFGAEKFNIGKGNNYGVENTQHWGIPQKGCLQTDSKIIAN